MLDIATRDELHQALLDAHQNRDRETYLAVVTELHSRAFCVEGLPLGSRPQRRLVP